MRFNWVKLSWKIIKHFFSLFCKISILLLLILGKTFFILTQFFESFSSRYFALLWKTLPSNVITTKTFLNFSLKENFNLIKSIIFYHSLQNIRYLFEIFKLFFIKRAIFLHIGSKIRKQALKTRYLQHHLRHTLWILVSFFIISEKFFVKTQLRSKCMKT